MLKDIPQLAVENIVIAVVQEPHEVTREPVWNVYLVNLYNKKIEGVMVSSHGYGTHEGRDVKTSTLRHFIGDVDSNDYAKIEPIMTNVFGLNNEYWVSFYLDKTMYDKKYIFLPETIMHKNFTMIPVLNKEGVMIR
jgi:hypothetical protein